MEGDPPLPFCLPTHPLVPSPQAKEHGSSTYPCPGHVTPLWVAVARCLPPRVLLGVAAGNGVGTVGFLGLGEQGVKGGSASGSVLP